MASAQMNVKKTYKTKGKRVVLAYIHPGQVSAYFVESMLTTVLVDDRSEQRIETILQDWSSANVSQSRNKLTSKFLDEFSADWLLWIDSDMAWDPYDVYRIIDSADPEKRPVVGGLCFGAMHGALFPTIYLWGETPEGKLVTYRPHEYPHNAMVPVVGTGAAFLLIHRSVLEKVRDHEFSKTFPFFQEMEWSGDPVGEDLAFCLRCAQLQIPVHVNTAIKIGHHKSHLLNEALFDAQQSLRETEDD
jgi:GT2 family glycosyltransferase